MKLVMTPKQFQTILILFFTNIASDLVSELPSASNVFSVGSNFLRNFYSSRNPQNYTFHIKEISKDFVFKELKRLSLSKSTSLDGLSARFSKDGPESIKTPISFIKNKSIYSGIVPEEMKFTSVRSIFFFLKKTHSTRC